MRFFSRFDITSVGANTISQFVGRMITAATGFVVALVIARRFGVVDFGEFTKVTTYVAFFYLLADFGFNAVFLKKNGIWSSLLGLRIFLSVFLMFFALGILALLPNSGISGYTTMVRTGIILFIPTILFQAIITSANAQFQKEHRYDVATRALIIGSIVSILLLVLYSTTPLSRLGFMGTLVVLSLGSLVTAVSALYFIRRFVPLSVSFSLPTALSYALSVLPIGLTLVFNVIYFRFDSFILTLTRSTIEVGLYGFAYKFFEFIIAIPTFYMNAVYPRFLKIQKEELTKTIIKSMWFLLLSSLFLMVLVFLSAPYLTLVRPEFEGSVTALRILSFGLPFFFLSSLTMWTFIALDKQYHLVWIYGSSMAVNIVLNVLLVPSYGYSAAAWTTVASEGLVLLMSGFILTHYYL